MLGKAKRSPSKFMPEKSGSPRVSLLLLGAAAFIVIADARVIDPLLHIIANEFQAALHN